MTEEELFAAAIQQPISKRAAFLDQACARDSSLRAQIQALLEAHDHPDSLFESHVCEVTLEAPTHLLEGVGTIIGPYKLLQQIGEGGMGIVYLAEQTSPVRRKVALKVIKPGMNTRHVVARFEAERQALALMDHPNIARVIDGGATNSSRPYFVMELVCGVSITEYCDKKVFSTRQRLELFVNVCRAVQHAHQRAIIHRDLKPTNILVTQIDAAPVVKVIDFGIAKTLSEQLTDKTLFTQFNQMLGTPLYMSPEQAEMVGQDIDTRTDVYSLGVVLYELLTGGTPFDKERLRESGYDEMRRIICEEEPPRPSHRVSTLQAEELTTISQQRGHDPRQLIASLRGEVDWIVIRALEKDRTLRYESASQFAEDIERFLRNEAVQACPPSRTYRLKKFARRNKAVLLTASLVTLALLVGTTVSIWQAVEARHARISAENSFAETDKQRREAEKQRKNAEQNLREARAAVERYFNLVSESTLLDEPGLLPLRLELIQNAVTFYEQFAAREMADSEVHLELALTYLQLGQIQFSLVQQNDSILALEKGLQLIESALLQRPAQSNAYRKLAGFWHIGQTQLVGTSQPIADPTHAAAVLQQGIDLWEKLERAHPGVYGFQSDMSKFYDFLEDQQQALRQAAAARLSMEKVRDIRERLVRNAPNNPEHKAELAYAYWGLIPMSTNDLEQTEKLFRKGIALQLEANLPAYRTELAFKYRLLGNFLQQHQRFHDAIAEYRRSLDLLVALSASTPHIRSFRVQMVVVQEELASAFRAVEEKQGEETSLRAAMAIYETLFSSSGSSTADMLLPGDPRLALVTLLSESGRNAEADQLLLRIPPNTAAEFMRRGQTYENTKDFAKALADYEKAIEMEPNNTLNRNHLGYFWSVQAKYDKAILELKKAIEINPQFAEALANLGAALFQHGGHLDEAIAHLTKAIEINPNHLTAQMFLGLALEKNTQRVEAISKYRRVLEVEPLNTWALLTLAQALTNQGQPDEAITQYRKVIELDPTNTWPYHELGNSLLRQGKPAEAITWYKKELELDPKNSRAYNRLGQALYDLGQQDEAITLYKTAIELDSKNTWAHIHLGNALLALGQSDEAIVLYKNAIEIDPKNTGAHTNLGNALLKLGKPDEAIIQYQTAIDDDPMYSPAYISLGNALLQLGQLDETVVLYQKASELDPRNGELHNSLAWSLAADAPAELRDIPRAVEFAKRAVELNPDQHSYWNTMGVVQYRAGNWKDALRSLTKSMELGNGGDSYDWFFLAMAHWQLGEKERAREWYDKAEAYRKEKQPANQELQRFGEEAQVLFGMRVDQPEPNQQLKEPAGQ